MDKKPDVFARFTRMSIGEALRALAVVAAAWTSIWAFGGDWVSARADEVLVHALKEKGMGPDDIKNMKSQLLALGVDVDALQKTSDHANDELDAIARRLDAMDANQRQTFELLKSMIPLLKAELQTP